MMLLMMRHSAKTVSTSSLHKTLSAAMVTHFRGFSKPFITKLNKQLVIIHSSVFYEHTCSMKDDGDKISSVTVAC